MATIIAPTIDDAPDSERLVYQLLREDAVTDSWVICHHLDTRPNYSRSAGRRRERAREIDFLVLIPGVGALCVEAKGGGFSVTGGQWRRLPSGDPMEPPGTQAQAGMYQLKDELTSQFARAWGDAELPIEPVVVLTDTDWPDGIRESGSSVIGLPGLEQQGAKSLAERLLEIARTARGAITHKELLPFDLQMVQEITAHLYPDFIVTPSARPEPYRSVERRIIRLTADQHQSLVAADDNERCLFQGAAGTGKTMLALELAKRRTAAGDRVALVCYNRILGDWLFNQQMEHFKLGDVTGSFWNHFAFTVIGQDSDRWAEFSAAMDAPTVLDHNERFDVITPEHTINSLLHTGPMFDYLVVDELQDMCQNPYLEILDLALRGGLAGGRWAMFADFNQQFTNWGRNQDSNIDNLHRYIDQSQYREHPLVVNCRNTLPIIQDAAGISGIPMPETYLNNVTGPSPSYEFWRDDAELRILLGRAVRGYVNNGERLSEIFVLGTRSLHESGQDLLGHTYNGYGLYDCHGIYWPPLAACDQVPCCQVGIDNDTYLKFREVRRFKGMESKVVILIVDRMNLPNDRATLYVGMTRARVNLLVLARESVRGNLTRLVGRSI